MNLLVLSVITAVEVVLEKTARVDENWALSHSVVLKLAHGFGYECFGHAQACYERAEYSQFVLGR
jgi:hypothetical protein